MPTSEFAANQGQSTVLPSVSSATLHMERCLIIWLERGLCKLNWYHRGYVHAVSAHTSEIEKVQLQ